MYIRIPVSKRHFLELGRRGINWGTYGKRGDYTSFGTRGFTKTFRLPLGFHLYFHNGRPGVYWGPRRRR